MYPYIHIGSFNLGTFGLFLWLAAVLGGVVLHRNFLRDHVDADALNIVALVTLAGVLGAKTWHELQDPGTARLALQQIAAPGWSHLGRVIMGFLGWMRGGIAWYGGLCAGIATLMWQGVATRPNGIRGWRAALRMLDLAAPAVPIGYGVGRIGCLTSGDGDYGKNTLSTFWGVHMRHDALVPPHPADALVLPTPLWELAAACLIAWIIWRLGAKARPLGFLTASYLVLSGISRFVIEFWRINPPLYFNHTLSNAQVAALGTILFGGIMIGLLRNQSAVGGSAVHATLQTQGPAV
jgi:phosphatidylglycerol:prolipoprotein diacylglycerol transferase